MNSQEVSDYIQKLKTQVMKEGFPFEYSEFCDSHEVRRIVKQKYGVQMLYPILQTKDTDNVILYMNQFGRQVTKRGKQGCPIYECFGMLSFARN